MKRLIYIISLLNIVAVVFAQTPDEVTHRLVEQLTEWPHEKIYVQTDKSAYLSGERIWLRSHLVEATTHIPAFLSRYVYVELFNPFGRLIQQIKIRPDSIGVYSGYLDLDEELPEGSYTLRAYTRYMRNQGNEAFFKKTIHVLDPYSLQIEPVPQFAVNGNKVSVNFRFVNPANGDTVIPELVTFKLSDETAKTISSDDNGIFNWDFTMTKKRNRNLLLGIVNENRKYNRYYPIPYDTNDFDITFHPEGGYLVPGQICKVGFKAINPSGLGEEIRGTLFDLKEREIVNFRSSKFGMGYFEFTPEPDEKYYAICRTVNGDAKRVDLPVADFRARTVSAFMTDDNRIVTSIRRGNAAPNDSVFILVHSRGVPYFHQYWEDQLTPYAFAAHNFPSGILSILLLSNKNEVLSERMVFNLNPNDFPALDAELSSPSYKRRELVSLRLRLEDSDTIAFADNMAISVTDKNAVLRDTTNSLLATLLLSSELKGFIESPASYFNGYTIADKNSLDALMMTQGWRRYDIPGVIRGEISVPDKFFPEQFQEITGRAEVLFGGLKEGEISLYATLDSLTSGEITQADEKGRFMFQVEYPEGTEITVQSLSRKGGRNNMINIDPVTFPDNTFSTVPVPALSTKQKDDVEAYLQKANEEYSRKNGIRTIMLEELTVTARNLEKQPESSFYSPLHATGLIDAKEIEDRKISSFRALLNQTPGLIVRADRVTTTRSDNPVIFIIDDIPYNDSYDPMEMIDIGDIETFFVMRDNVGLIGHYPGTDGAVVINTKRGFVQKNVISKNINRLTPLGYQLPAEFYTPTYETQAQKNSSIPDLRTTIYWKPNVQFSREGEALVEFYAADTPTTYQIIGEGVTSSGKMIRLEEEVSMESTY